MVLVVGSANMDIVLSVDHSPKEGESMLASGVEYIPGGKGANQAIALARLEASTAFIGSVGDDAFGKILISVLLKAGVDTEKVLFNKTSTGTAYIILEKNGNNRIIVDPGANMNITPSYILENEHFIKNASALLLQLEIPVETVKLCIKLCKKHGIPAFVDAGPIRKIKALDLSGAYCVSPNQSELSALAGRKLVTNEEITIEARKILDYDISCVLLKEGEKGCTYIDRERVIHHAAYPVKAVDTTAAGDSFMAGFVSAFTKRLPLENCLDCACAAGAYSVTIKGASSSLPYKKNIDDFLKDCV